MSKEKPATTNDLGLPLWKKVLFSLIATLLFFGVLELVLTIGGVRPLLYDDDPHVGFASNVPLFVEGEGGIMVTASNKVRWFNKQQFAQKKPAGMRRVFCVGGSTTYGRPYADSTSFCGWLREYLPAANPEKEWEVINAGGISYASYRVTKLMEELIKYEPDLFIIYSGHNEFLEERTYAGIIRTPEAVRGMQAALGRTRTYSFMAGLLRSNNDAAESGSATPVLTEEVNTILDQSAGLDRYTRDPQLESTIVDHYRYNLSRMVDIAQSVGAEIVFVTPAANLASSSPFKSEHRAGLTDTQRDQWQTHHDQAEKDFDAMQYDDALTAIEKALSIDDEYAYSHYMKGQALQALKRFDDARISFTAALETDVCPLRILPGMQTIVAETASKRNVEIFDFDAFLQKRSGTGVPGDEWFLDHVHPTVEGHRLLALKLISVMENRGLLLARNALTEESIQKINERVMAGVDDEARGIALRNLGNVLNWAGKKQEAYATAKKALTLAPGDAYAHYLVGSLAGKLNKIEEAEEHFRELTRFDLDPQQAPYFADAHYQLAQLVGTRGETRESVSLLYKTIQLQPDHEGAQAALPILLRAEGTQLLQNGRSAEAVVVFKKLAHLVPGDSMAANLLGAALIQEKNFPQAIDVLTRALAKDQRNPSIHNNLGSAYARSNQPDKAAHHFGSAIKSNPAHIGAHLNLARLLESLGKSDEAVSHYRSVIKLNPNSAEARAGLERLENSNG